MRCYYEILMTDQNSSTGQMLVARCGQMIFSESRMINSGRTLRQFAWNMKREPR